jgi:hypothetical protein
MTELEKLQIQIDDEKAQIGHLKDWIRRLEKVKAHDEATRSNIKLYKELIEERRRCLSLLRKIEKPLKRYSARNSKSTQL